MSSPAAVFVRARVGRDSDSSDSKSSSSSSTISDSSSPDSGLRSTTRFLGAAFGADDLAGALPRFTMPLDVSRRGGPKERPRKSSLQRREDSAIRGRCQAQVGAHGSIALGKAAGDLGLVLQGRDDDHVVSALPIGGSRDLVRIGELQRVDDAQDLLEVPARAGGVGDEGADLLVRIDEEYRAHRERVVRFRVDHVVEVRDLAVRIGEDRIVELTILGLFVVLRPLSVAVYGIDADREDLDVSALELLGQVRDAAKLGGADRGEVLGVREQHAPALAEPLVKVDATRGRVLVEVGGDAADVEGHGGTSSAGSRLRQDADLF